MKSDLHDVDVHIHAETQTHTTDAGAIRVSLDGDDKKAVWLPKSQVQFERRSTRAGVLTAPEWILHEKGLI